MSPRHLVGLCRAIVDQNLILSGRDADILLEDHGLVRGVHFLTDEILATVQRAAIDKCAAVVTETPGGPISNSLAAIAHGLGPIPWPTQLTWLGMVPIANANLPNDPLVSLRKAGVATGTVEANRQGCYHSLCLIDRANGETIAVLVGDRDPLPVQLLAQMPVDALLVQVSDVDTLLRSNVKPRNVAVFLADAVERPDKGEAALVSLERLAGGPWSLLVSGRLSEFRAMGLVDTSNEPVPWIRGAEIVATDGPSPVWFWSPELGVSYELPVSRDGGEGGSTLGAGDAYAGVYFFERLNGQVSKDAHRRAVQAARLASYSLDARADYSLNLTRLFGDYIDRESSVDDWWLFDRIRQSAGLAVISCNNTGVDNAALRVSKKLGLAHFAVMPSGCRRDDSPSEFDMNSQAFHVFEVGTKSYRYCTWSNVYLSDGTLLLDIARGEGSQETRRAARHLGRPLLEVEIGASPTQLAVLVGDWISQNSIRVLNVAGSRDARIPPCDLPAVENTMETALRAGASVFGYMPVQNNAHGRSRLPGAVDDQLIFGLPALAEVSLAVREVLFGPNSESRAPRDELTWRANGWTFVRGKSIDVARAVARGMLPIALVGGDIANEVGGLVTIAEVGLFNCLIAEVERSRTVGVPNSIVTQYPHLTGQVYDIADVEIVPVLGSAEAWVAAGLVDCAIDTWRTGRTANRHGLRIKREFMRSSLRLVRGPDEVTEEVLALGLELVLGLQGRRKSGSPVFVRGGVEG